MLEAAVIVLYLAVLSVLGLYGAHRGLLLFLYWRHRKEMPQPGHRFARLPLVTVQLPMYNEMYVVERLLEGIAAIDYPKDKLEIQVLDDSTDETVEIAKRKVEELKARGFDVVYRHRTNRT